MTLVKGEQDDTGIQLAGAGHRGHFYVKTLNKGVWQIRIIIIIFIIIIRNLYYYFVIINLYSLRFI